VILRDYQQDLVEGAFRLWMNERRRRIAMVLATGGGKTVVGMRIAETMLSSFGLPVLWIAHRTELIDQAVDKAQQVAPTRRIGRYQGSTKEYKAEVVVASIQTASTPTGLARLSTRRWGLIVVDETHHVAADTYVRVLKTLGAYEPTGPLVLGITATLDRGDRRSLGEIFEEVVDPVIGLAELIKREYLVPLRGIRIRIADLDLDKVKRSAGDFSGRALGQAMSDAMAPRRIVEAWQEHAKGRQTLAFLPSVEMSRDQAAAFVAAGIPAVHCDADTPKEQRAGALNAYRTGTVTVICNVGLFTEGTDLPETECVILGRPTSSTPLYQQMAGRGTRLAPGKRDCIILDVAGSTKRHKLATLVSLSGAEGPEDMPDDLLVYEIDELSDDVDLDTLPDAGEATEPIDYADGDLEHEMFDLFGKSHSTWLRTLGGRWFIPAGHGGYLYLVPASPDRYHLRYWHAPSGTGGALREDMEIGYAMAAGDEIVEQNPVWMMHRDAGWRAGGRGERFDREAIRRASAVLDE
jgi:superfamily II DNA or RNA helicase